MNNLKNTYRAVFAETKIRSFFEALFIFTLSLVFQFYASLYSTKSGGQFVGDVFLDNIPAINVNFIVVGGALWAIFIAVCLLFLKPKYIIFTLKASAIFISLRCFFVSVTHLGIYPNEITPGSGFFDDLYVAMNLQGGHFFSAHTGLPLLMAFIFWKERKWRIFFLCTSFIFGISVLLAHVHYSIDVFAAPFMTYSIFKMAQYIFHEDYKLMTMETKKG